MGQLHTLLTPTDEYLVSSQAAIVSTQAASVVTMEAVRCSLCGTPLKGNRLRFHMVPPRFSGVTVTVCSTCRRAAIGEGYRPAD